MARRKIDKGKNLRQQVDSFVQMDLKLDVSLNLNDKERREFISSIFAPMLFALQERGVIVCSKELIFKEEDNSETTGQMLLTRKGMAMILSLFSLFASKLENLLEQKYALKIKDFLRQKLCESDSEGGEIDDK